MAAEFSGLSRCFRRLLYRGTQAQPSLAPSSLHVRRLILISVGTGALIRSVVLISTSLHNTTLNASLIFIGNAGTEYRNAGLMVVLQGFTPCCPSVPTFIGTVVTVKFLKCFFLSLRILMWPVFVALGLSPSFCLHWVEWKLAPIRSPFETSSR
jgi:hypothetical protein